MASVTQQKKLSAAITVAGRCGNDVINVVFAKADFSQFGR